MERDLGDDELEEWKAFHFFEPFGAPADDDRSRLLYTLLWQFNAVGSATMPDWLDRDPEETARVRRINNLLSMDDDMDAFFSSMVARQREAGELPPVPVEDHLVHIEPVPVPAKRRRKKPST